MEGTTVLYRIGTRLGARGRSSPYLKQTSFTTPCSRDLSRAALAGFRANLPLHCSSLGIQFFPLDRTNAVCGSFHLISPSSPKRLLASFISSPAITAVVWPALRCLFTLMRTFTRSILVRVTIIIQRRHASTGWYTLYESWRGGVGPKMAVTFRASSLNPFSPLNFVTVRTELPIL